MTSQIVQDSTWTRDWNWSIDLLTDDSYTKFVSPEVPFLKQDYIPSDLVGISNSWWLRSNKEISLRQAANFALQQMARDFHSNFSGSLIIVSWYRSFAYQQWIEERSPQCIRDWFCARAGHSEHQSWLAIDLFETTNEVEFLKNEKYKQYFIWLQNNAHKYGFINSYTQGREIDGYHKEPWHWRYVWVEFAQYLNQSWISFSEYYQKVTTN
jgi:D-alanyl-D-alanine carboxypeptidase